MAEEKIDRREINVRQLLPWTEIFRGFQVALDPKKLILAAAGILLVSVGNWAISGIFYTDKAPVQSDYERDKTGDALAKAQQEYKADVKKHEKLQELAATGGRFNTWPWKEDRGPNPYLMMTGQEKRKPDVSYFVHEQLHVLLEPLYKLLYPVVQLLRADNGFWNTMYITSILLWNLLVWAIFGGAISRIAIVQLARKEKISLSEAVRFTLQRYWSFFAAPLVPLVVVVFLVLCTIAFGFLLLIPVVGEILGGLGYPLILLAGLVMAVILVGLIGWPLMYSTIAAEGSDSFDALSRSYSYIYSCPWHYLWNCIVAMAYGAVLVFFVSFVGSFMAYLGKWGVSLTPFAQSLDREPAYLYLHAPESYGWRQLLLENTTAMQGGEINKRYVDDLSTYNYIGTYLVSVWLYLFFLMVVGFGYSYFWSASAIIYLLMRKQVDDTELDEVYLEEDDLEDTYSVPIPSKPEGKQPLQMVDAPAMRPPPSSEPKSGDPGKPT